MSLRELIRRAEGRPELTTEQRRRLDEVNARNAKIQEVGPRPLDGVTFAKKPGK